MGAPILAGFECGVIQHGKLDLLEATRHLPWDRQGIHYGMARALGIYRARDGLPATHAMNDRLRTAVSAGMDVTWDLCHFDPSTLEATRRHADRVVLEAANLTGPFRACAVNEPSIVPLLTENVFSLNDAIERALLYQRILSDGLPWPLFQTVDVINGGGEHQFEATDRILAASDSVAVVGVNYYPHDASQPLSDVLIQTWRRYGLPVQVSETSWHDGHAGQAERFPFIRSKGHWLRYVLGECARAQDAGVKVDGVCWYPFTDMPSWDEPDVVWSNGLIRRDLQVDLTLEQAIREVTHV